MVRKAEKQIIIKVEGCVGCLFNKRSKDSWIGHVECELLPKSGSLESLKSVLPNCPLLSGPVTVELEKEPPSESEVDRHCVPDEGPEI